MIKVKTMKAAETLIQSNSYYKLYLKAWPKAGYLVFKTQEDYKAYRYSSIIK